MTKSHITKLYQNLLRDIATKEFYKVDLTNRVNYYVCYANHNTKTIDIDAGTTPFMIPCPICGQNAMSRGYKEDNFPDIKPAYEWFRPTLDQVLKMQKKPHLLDHYLKGGLDYRKIKTNLKIA